MDICYFLRIQAHRSKAKEKSQSPGVPLVADENGTQGMYIDQF